MALVFLTQGDRRASFQAKYPRISSLPSARITTQFEPLQKTPCFFSTFPTRSALVPSLSW